VSRIGFILAVLAIIGLIRQRAIFAGNPIGVAAQICAVALVLWARMVFGRRSFHASAEPTEGGLVTTGPYRRIRHPIYTALLLFLAAGVFSHVSVASVSLLAAVVVAMVARMVAEERLIVHSYPDYVEYAARTKRMIPFVY
jgi:protein-S-isoprenylcysteine O-methyltransferase Ste14